MSRKWTMAFSDRAMLLAVNMLAMVGCGVTIDSGQRGIYYNWRTGTDTEQVLGEGFHWLAPWNKVMQYDIRAKDRVEKLNVLTQDQLQVNIDVSIRFRLEANKLPLLHTNVGPEYYMMVIQPVLRNATRDVISRYESLDAFRARVNIQNEIRKEIVPALKKYEYFQVEAIMLRSMDFPALVVKAIERKKAMQQEAEREKYALEKEKIAAQRKIVEAEATAKAQSILKAELNELLLRFKGIEATLKLAESPNTKVVVVGSGKDGMPLILGGAEVK
jgi:regulator of protease activity HflC (stomatin/prohibitin superfamily)